MKIFILNEHDSNNIGDQAIAEGMASLARENNLDARFIGLESGKQKRPQSTPKKAVRKSPPYFLRVLRKLYLPIWAIKKFKHAERLSKSLSPHDIVIIGGGGVLMNNNYHFPISLASWAFHLTRKSVPFHVIGVSSSGNLSYFAKRMITYCLRRAKTLYARDVITQSEIIQYTRRVVEICPDMAFGLPPPRIANATREIAINVTSKNHNFSNESFKEYISNIIKLIHNQEPGTKIGIFTTGEPSDQAQANEIYAAVKNTENIDVHLEDRPNSTSEIIEIISKYKLIICSRLHSAILSLICERPTKIVAYDKKALGLFKTLNLNENIIKIPDIPTAGQLLKKNTIHCIERKKLIDLFNKIATSNQ